MKKFFLNHHYEIDVWSVRIFVYSFFVCLFLKVFQWLNDEMLYVFLVISLPLLFVNKAIINRLNKLLHSIFGFGR